MDIKNLGNLPFKQNPSEEEVVKNKARGKVIKK